MVAEGVCLFFFILVYNVNFVARFKLISPLKIRALSIIPNFLCTVLWPSFGYELQDVRRKEKDLLVIPLVFKLVS